MSFNADWNERLSKDDAKEILKEALVLGYSDNDKDCYWTCYQLDNIYYIGLNGEDDIWEVEKEDIDDYNENPK